MDKPKTIEGMFFMTRNDQGLMQYTGKIISELVPQQLYLVALHSAMTMQLSGMEDYTHYELKLVHQMMDWKLYDEAEWFSQRYEDELHRIDANSRRPVTTTSPDAAEE